jgi:hypothetical protein
MFGGKTAGDERDLFAVKADPLQAAVDEDTEGEDAKEVRSTTVRQGGPVC